MHQPIPNGFPPSLTVCDNKIRSSIAFVNFKENWVFFLHDTSSFTDPPAVALDQDAL
jgi:hypothetical protein